MLERHKNTFAEENGYYGTDLCISSIVFEGYSQ